MNNDQSRVLFQKNLSERERTNVEISENDKRDVKKTEQKERGERIGIARKYKLNL